jgi:xylulokinase
VAQIYATGGGARSPLWRQIQADIYQAEVVTINIAEGPAFGAAILAGVGTGVYQNVEAATDQMVEITSSTQPISENVEIYNQYYQIYRDLYPALKLQFDQVTQVVAQQSSDN